jgi:hypothetical protein
LCLPTSPTAGNLARDIEGGFVGQVGVFPDCVLRVRISRPVSHLEFIIGQCAPLVFGRPYAKHNGIV